MLFLAGKSAYYEHQSLWSKSCSNNAYLLGCLRFIWQKCISLIHCCKCVCSLLCTWYITGLHQNVIWQKCISLYVNFCLNAKVYNSMLLTTKVHILQLVRCACLSLNL